jgi:hypothetical protein
MAGRGRLRLHDNVVIAETIEREDRITTAIRSSDRSDASLEEHPEMEHAAMTFKLPNRASVSKVRKEPRFSRTNAPADLSPKDWQRTLRRQFGSEQSFGLENLGDAPFFSEFRVSNPGSKSAYRVAIRGLGPGGNFCSCPDYATNELGTCKHIEFVLSRLTKKRGAKAAFARGYRPAFSELYLRNDGRRAIYFRAGTDCPPSVIKAAAPLFDPSRGGLLRDERFGDLEDFIAKASKSGHILRVYDDTADFIAGRRDAERRAQALDRLFPRGAADPRLENLLSVPLYHYQAEGALFAVRAGRALIGDDMGLGKTVQAIAAAEILAQHFGVTKVLVICPASLKYQWQSEIARFAARRGRRMARVLEGGRAQRQQAFAQDDFCKIINYEKLQPDLDLIAAWAPELVIVDEAQRVKNWNTIAARALKRIDSPYAIVLTGTPLENRLEELISIVQFVDQYRLGPTWKLLYEHQVRDEAGRVTGYTGLERIGRTLAPIMIRRRKSEVLRQLPSRTDQNLLVPMTDAQMTVHRENADIVAKIVQRWRRTKFLSDSDQRRMTCALQNMRMSCNSTYLLDRESDHGVKADELAALFDEMLAQPASKAVVFSQWQRTHDIVVRRLDARGLGYVSFHGGIPSEKRPALLERFREDPACRVFLSTDAGSTGLNLQHASTLINMDLPWNPAVLEQRIARIHRMGQKRPVQVVNFVAKGTIEEGMLSVLAFKRSLSAGILDGGASEISLGGSRLNRFMKDVENVTAHMGQGEVLTSAEEEGSGAVGGAEAAKAVGAPAATVVGQAGERLDGAVAPAREADGDPWQVLVSIGAQFVAALAAANDPAAATRPSIESDAAIGARHLKMPLPGSEMMGRLADALSAIAESLRKASST